MILSFCKIMQVRLTRPKAFHYHRLISKFCNVNPGRNDVIEVEHVSKVYNGRKAVDDISFKVEKGEILGFLGPNGAGKTTTMRILTCYMPSTEGTARVAGYDVFEESLEVRKRIGYLPENPPALPGDDRRVLSEFRREDQRNQVEPAQEPGG